MRRVRAAIKYRLINGAFGRLVATAMQRQVYVEGPRDRLLLGADVDLSGAYVNTISGDVTVGDHTFVAHNVSLITGKHDPTKRNYERFATVPLTGRDIVIGEGVWLASNCTVIGPCRIGDHAVIAAGAVVTSDVAALTIVAGVPARPIGLVGG